MKNFLRDIFSELVPLILVGMVINIVLCLGIGWWASRPYVALKEIWHLHRQEFVEIADHATKSWRDTCSYESPSSTFYKRIFISDADRICLDQKQTPAAVWKKPTKIWIEFIVDDFYLPIVYIESDDPMDVYDTCSQGGIPTDKLEPHWYICKRDWN